jgi:D-glycero-alpha-D-manno-heptose-7-phosphate kinase
MMDTRIPASRDSPAPSLVVRAPTRIDFGGGWTDVPPYSDECGGFVCNVAISRYATVRVERSSNGSAPEIVVARDADRALLAAALSEFDVHGISVSLHNDFPVGAGLGGSSAAGVAIAAALAEWKGAPLDRRELPEVSRAIEIGKLGVPGGRQDHYAATFGGALGLRFGGTVTVEKIALSDETRDEVARRCLVIYTGQSRISGDTITAVLDAYRAGDMTVVTALRRMRELAEEMPRALAHGDLDGLGALVEEQWAHQRSLHPAISTPRIEAIMHAAHEAGAAGTKALGASGGGCVLVVARAPHVERVRTAVAPLGDLLDYSIDEDGVTTCE